MTKKPSFNLYDPMEMDGGARQSDLIIPVMGKTGSGKSSFINMIPCHKKMEVGHQLTSCTQGIGVAIVDPQFVAKKFPNLQGRRIIMVDTPGFGDTYRSDLEILHVISDWLASSYSRRMKLAGIVYLHPLDDPRMDNPAMQNLAMFEKLCGKDAFDRVVLGTTKWKEGIREEREEELKKTFWQNMISKNSRVMRVKNSEASVCEILTAILTTQEKETVLAIQKELVDKLKQLPDTAAGQKLRKFLEQDLALSKGKVGEHDTGLTAEAKAEQLAQLERMQRDFEQLRQLSFFHKLKSWLRH